VTAARRRRGRAGEERAAAWYVERGWEIVDRNWRVREGEIDLVVRRGATLVFCEVKTRSSDRFGTAAEAVTPAKQRRVRMLARRYLAAGGVHAAEVRFDVAAVTGGRVEVVEGAF
jgi:putative endonuclease